MSLPAHKTRARCFFCRVRCKFVGFRRETDEVERRNKQLTVNLTILIK